MNLPPSPYYTERVHRDYRNMITAVWLLTRDCNFKCVHCVSKGTKVRYDKKNKNIENIKVGDKVISYNIDGNFVKTEVRKIMNRKTDEYYQLELKDKKTIQITGEHPIMTKRGWIEVKDLKENDEVLTNE